MPSPQTPETPMPVIMPGEIIAGSGIMWSTRRPDPMWSEMASAPHDGTVIEVRCTCGVAPWFKLHRWDVEQQRWADAKDPAFSFTESRGFMWRPYTDSIENYVDPTGGQQYDPRYWREAAARSLGRPANYFDPVVTAKEKRLVSVISALLSALGIAMILFFGLGFLFWEFR